MYTSVSRGTRAGRSPRGANPCRLFLLTALALALTAGAAPADPPEVAQQKEMKGLEGTWEVRSGTSNGGDLRLNPSTLTLSAGRYTVRSGGKTLESGTFTVDPGKAPKAFDYVADEGLLRGVKTMAVYEFQGGDGLRMAFVRPGQERPTDFSGKGSQVILFKKVGP
jgi:uncharacterized protein (TIGR03067 family)